jgi:hypothetical protein
MKSPEPQPDRRVSPGTTWGDLINALVDANGTLAAVAWRLVEHADGDDVASVERALRRLRVKGQRDGGAWGQRVLRVFGVPVAIEDRVRWLGLYHSPFNDLPVALCLDQLRLWDRPPVATSRARVWVHLGFASCAMRTRRFDDAATYHRRATEALAALGPEYDMARIEAALIEGYLVSRRDDAAAVTAALDRAASMLASSTIVNEVAGARRSDAATTDRATLSAGDRACFQARIADQRAYQLNRAGDHAAALALYEALPADVHPFASYRRDAGLAYGAHRAGRTDDAIVLARRACEHAGDGGYTRLRAMGLLLLAKIAGDRGALERARAIAVRLGDDELLARADRIV